MWVQNLLSTAQMLGWRSTVACAVGKIALVVAVSTRRLRSVTLRLTLGMAKAVSSPSLDSSDSDSEGSALPPPNTALLYFLTAISPLSKVVSKSSTSFSLPILSATRSLMF